MTRNHLLGLLLALVLLPAAYAHTDGSAGGSKLYCEDLAGDWHTHDYFSGTGFTLSPASDASVPPCAYDPTWDGHYEFAYGGAYLLACEAFCVSPDGLVGAGASQCWDTYADHEQFPRVYVNDLQLSAIGLDVAFTIAVDWWNNVPPVDPTHPECGDLETDIAVDCVNDCQVPFPPGLDGAYLVYVQGTQGHVSTGARAPDTLIPAAPLSGKVSEHAHPHVCEDATPWG